MEFLEMTFEGNGATEHGQHRHPDALVRPVKGGRARTDRALVLEVRRPVFLLLDQLLARELAFGLLWFGRLWRGRRMQHDFVRRHCWLLGLLLLLLQLLGLLYVDVAVGRPAP